jgi:hypothetical protein
MPLNSQPTSSPLFTHLAVDPAGGERNELRNQPFVRLVAHFAALILYSGGDSGASDLNLRIGGLLALLAAPGGIIALLLFEKYSSLLRVLRGGPLHIDVYSASVPDKYFLIVCSMVVTGAVVALKWEGILPGRQDYLNLAPLPLRLPAIFWANFAAVVLLASIFAVDVNAVSSVLFPLVVMSETGGLRENLQFFGVHLTCVILASAFAFLACFSLMGILMSVLIIDRVMSKSPFQSACYHFSLRVLVRSETHFIVLGAFAGLGLVVASQMVLSPLDTTHTQSVLPTPDVLAAPFAMAYRLIVGVRFVLELPAELNANWVYRVVLGRQKHDAGAVAKKVILTILIPLVIIPCVIGYSWIWGVRVGFVHAAYVLGLSVALIDIVLLRFRKIPFCVRSAFV